MAKKLSKKTLNCKITVFWQFFGHKSGYGKDFSKCFFFLAYILEDASFDIYIAIFGSKKNFDLILWSAIFFGTQNHRETCFKWADFFSGAFNDQKTWEKLCSILNFEKVTFWRTLQIIDLNHDSNHNPPTPGRANE